MMEFWTNSLILVLALACMVPVSMGGAGLSLEQCRSPRRNSGEHFALNECRAGQVISIQSAEVGFNTRWDPRQRRSRCSQRDVGCKRSTQHPGIARCNGQRTCRIDPNVLAYPQGNVERLCSRHRDANFLAIRYQCIPGPTNSVSVSVSGTVTMLMMMTMPPVSSSSAGGVTNYSAVGKPVPTAAQEPASRFNFRTLSMGEIVGLIIGAGLLLLALVAFLVLIIICICRHRREKPYPTKDVASSAEQHQNAGDVEHRGDAAVTPQNNYQSLQRHHLRLPQLRTAIAAYCQLSRTD